MIYLDPHSHYCQNIKVESDPPKHETKPDVK